MLLGDSSAALSYACVMLAMVTDFDPYSFLIQSELGKFMPIGVAGYDSPPSIATLMTFAETPVASFFLKRGSTGEWSSNHWAWLLMISVRREASTSLKFTCASQAPFLPIGSAYTSINPLMKSAKRSVS